MQQSIGLKSSVKEYLLGRLTRRSFVSRLMALGFTSTAGQGYTRLLAHPSSSQAQAQNEEESTHRVVGTGGEILVEQLRQSGVEFLFTAPSSGTGPVL